ncbi:MAG: sporulation protein YqfD [Ruminococcaceae bacterium]|nr:sporulation protein YqfD [Oscillospiraceae bacterium]
MKLLHWFRGFVRIRVRGFFVERFLNICMHRGIYLWDVTRRGAESVELNMSARGFGQIRPIARKTHSRVTILRKSGLPIFIARHRKRKAFLVGALIAMVLFCYLTSFVWVIEVTGNETVDTSRITESLAAHGFSEGRLRFGVDVLALQNRVLLDVSELSWLWVDIHGTKATVEVREKKPIPEMVDKSEPCNIVARRGGLLTEVAVTEGEKMVSVGDVVSEGELLVSGVTDSKYEGVRFLHSMGSIRARTWYEKEGEFPPVRVEFQKTGKKISKNTINFFGFEVKLYLDKSQPFAYCEKETKVHRATLGFDRYLPLSLNRDIYHQTERVEIPLTEEEVVFAAKEKLCAEVEAEFDGDTQVVSRSHSHILTDSGNIKVKVEYECTEEIGRQVPVLRQ